MPWGRLGGWSYEAKPLPVEGGWGEALAINLYLLRGQYAVAAFLMEGALAGWLQSADSKNAAVGWQHLGPALVGAYRQMQRYDWAMEAYVGLEGAAKGLGGRQGEALRVEGALALEDDAQLQRTLKEISLSNKTLSMLSVGSLSRLMSAHVHRGRGKQRVRCWW